MYDSNWSVKTDSPIKYTYWSSELLRCWACAGFASFSWDCAWRLSVSELVAVVAHVVWRGLLAHVGTKRTIRRRLAVRYVSSSGGRLCIWLITSFLLDGTHGAVFCLSQPFLVLRDRSQIIALVLMYSRPPHRRLVCDPEELVSFVYLVDASIAPREEESLS